MSAKLRQSPDFTKGLRDVLDRKGIKHRFRPKQMKCCAQFGLYPLNMVKKSMQNESTTLKNEPSQVQKKTTNNALPAHELRTSPISSRERKIVPSWWYVFTLVMKKAYAHEGKIRWWVGGDTRPCRAGFFSDLKDTHPYFTKLHRPYSWVASYSVRAPTYRYESFSNGLQLQCCPLVLLKQKSRQEKQKIIAWITLKTKKLRFIIK